MAAQDVPLHRRRLRRADPLAHEGAEACRDAVDRLATLDRVLERSPVAFNGRERGRVERDRRAGSDSHDRIEIERSAG
jgi:hypothetical protein